MTVEDLIDYIPGRISRRAGQIVGVSGIRQAYRTGRGKIRVRAKAEIEVEKDGRERIVITEIPYQVNKEMMVANIRELAHEKRIEGIADANDESDSQGMRVVVDLKKGFNANVILNQLYKHTQMQTTFGVIMIALVGTEPKVLNLKEIIVEYVDYQREIITRRTRFDLEKAEKRAPYRGGPPKSAGQHRRDHRDDQGQQGRRHGAAGADGAASLLARFRRRRFWICGSSGSPAWSATAWKRSSPRS